MSEKESGTAEREREIRGAVARGWCSDKNRFKGMDVDLAESISQEVAAYCASRERAAEEVVCKEVADVLRKMGASKLAERIDNLLPNGALARVVQQALEVERERYANLVPACGEKCGAPAASLIPRWGMSFACVLPKGHEGEHRQGGNCFKHGEYVGDKCPQWPRCIPNAASNPDGLLELAREREGKMRAELRLAYHMLHDSRDHHGYFKTCTQASCVANRTVLEMK